MESFISAQTQQNKEFLNQDIHINELIKQLGTKVYSMITHNKMLEIQTLQIAQQQAPQATPEGQFPGQPQPNPRGQDNVVTLQSGTTYDEPVKPVMKVEEVERQKDQKVKDKGENKDKVYVPPSPYKPPILFPQRLKERKNDDQYKKFIKVIEKLHLEIPFTEAITQIPSYAKFLKDILTNKRGLDDPKPLECNSIAENKLAKKEKDPGSFSIPCILGNNVIEKAFLDLEASISLMLLAVCKRINLGELQPTKMYLQLADRSVKYSVGILEDIPVRIKQLYVRTDFMVMEIKEDDEVPILIGRPFLSSVGSIIDVKRGKLTFKMSDEKIEFILSKFLMAPVIEDSCYAIDIIDECIRELDQERPAETMKYSSTSIREGDGFRLEPHMDDNLYECLALTPNHMPCPKKLSIELKELPKNLRYEFLDQELNHPVIVSATLNRDETSQILDILLKYPSPLGYNIFDLKGISPSGSMHRILMEEDSKPSREHQRRLNPIMSDVVKKEVLKLLEAGIIYQISYSKWVSPVHVVPKKGGVTVVENEKGEHVAKHVENGWRMCIDYRKLNKMDTRDFSKFPFTPKIKRKQPLHALTERLPIDECPSNFAMPQPPSNAV
ncbi:uncharacterized protein LOC127078615 [Lathyrus oleraceus]|uniref:uncharacterized protein LOC127078615 n=1 Tax=Pisum sativum TaxID=3888 RepID=UPI0021D36029|nr:uncharacterized protein LOC127078615 [Pisum sativum]